jgi:hypothetical protein
MLQSSPAEQIQTSVPPPSRPLSETQPQAGRPPMPSQQQIMESSHMADAQRPLLERAIDDIQAPLVQVPLTRDLQPPSDEGILVADRKTPASPRCPTSTTLPPSASPIATSSQAHGLQSLPPQIVWRGVLTWSVFDAVAPSPKEVHVQAIASQQRGSDRFVHVLYLN